MPSPPSLVDDTILSKSYSLHNFRIHSSTSISTRVTGILNALTGNPGDGVSADPEQQQQQQSLPPLVALSARAKTSSKLISIVEIAKREMKGRGRECFQYSSLSSEILEIPRADAKKKNLKEAQSKGSNVGARGGAKDDEDEDNEEEEEAAFQAMTRDGVNAGQGGMKKRNVPVLTIYLATAEVRELASLG